MRVESLRLDAGGWAVMECPFGPEDVGLALRCPLRGVLAARGPATFVRRIGLDIGVTGRGRRVRVPPTAQRPGVNVDSQNASVERREVGGAAPDARARLVEIRSRKSRNVGGQGRQIWLPSGAAGREAIRELVAAARRGIAIVDPYLDAAALLELSQSVSLNVVEVRALVGRPYVKRKDAKEGITAAPGSGAAAALTEGAELAIMAQLLAASRQLTNARVKVMAAGTALHGRYLAVDDAVWMLSESFKDLGSSPGAAVRLPYPDPARTAIEMAWAAATDVGAFAPRVEARSTDPGAGGGTGT